MNGSSKPPNDYFSQECWDYEPTREDAMCIVPTGEKARMLFHELHVLDEEEAEAYEGFKAWLK